MGFSVPAFSTMKRLFVLFSLLSCVGGSAQNMKNFYRQAKHDEGTLYFVFPREMACCEAGPGGFSGSLSYDYTYLDARDSVAMLMTVATDGVFEADSVCFETVRGAFGFGAEPIYRTAGKREWRSRLRCVVPYDLWAEMYRASEPFVLRVYSSKSGAGPGFSDKRKTWKKIRPYFGTLQETIRLNR